jgi:hypothetical protein
MVGVKTQHGQMERQMDCKDWSAMWIGGDDDQFNVGDVGFLVNTYHETKQWDTHRLRQHPPKTNQSFQPRLYGWCGTTNGVACYGMGLAQVVKVAKNGRAYVKHLSAEEATKLLNDELGYPELVDQLAD